MLERALLQQATENNVIENAHRWGIEVWSLEKALRLVEELKASAQLKRSVTGKQKCATRKFVKEISGPFVKIEAFSRHYRPVYKVLSSWPKLRLDCPVGASPFDPVWRSPPGDTGRPRHEAKLRGSWAKRRMTRRAKPRLQGGGAGFCELCQVAYTNFEKHLISDGHIKLAQDDRSYMSLDNLIRQRHSLAPLVTMNGASDICMSGCPTRRSPRSNKPHRAISLDAEPSKRPYPLRLSVDDHPTKRNDMLLESNCLMNRRSASSREASMNGIVADDSYPRTRRLRHSVSVSPEGSAASLPKNEVIDSLACDKPRLAKISETKEQQQHCELIKRKRLSAEEKLLEDNRQYYKVEVLSCKLRSTGFIIGQKRAEDQAEESASNREDPPQSPPAVRLNGDVVSVDSLEHERRTKKSRRSLLSLLNDEAENFMFGVPAKSNESDLEDAEGHNSPQNELSETSGSCTVESAKHHSSTNVKRESVESMCENGHCDQSPCGTSTESESDQGQGSKKKRRTQSELFIHDNLDYYKFEISESRLRAHGAGKVDSEMKENMSASIKEDSKGSPDLEDESRIENDVQLACSPCIEELHFSFENVPQSEPWFRTFERQDKGDTLDMYYSDPCTGKPFLLPYEMPPEKMVPSGQGHQPPLLIRRKKRRKHMVGKLPRKSPRCHASTLAMLSGLISKRKSRALLAPPPPPAPAPALVENNKEELVREEKDVVKSESTVEQKGESEEVNKVKLICKVQNSVFDDLVVRAAQLEKMLVSCEEDNEDLGNSSKGSAGGKSGRRKSRGKSVSDGNSGFDIDPAVMVNNSDEVLRWKEPFIECRTNLSTVLEGKTHCECWSHVNTDSGDLSSECASTCDTVSDFGARRRHLRSAKKRKRNMTGWPRDRPRKKYRVINTDVDKLSIVSVKPKDEKPSVTDNIVVDIDSGSVSDSSEKQTEASVNSRRESLRRLRPPKLKTTYLCLRKRR